MFFFCVVVLVWVFFGYVFEFVDLLKGVVCGGFGVYGVFVDFDLSWVGEGLGVVCIEW